MAGCVCGAPFIPSFPAVVTLYTCFVLGHGGYGKCTEPNCTSMAQSKKKCGRHGGSTTKKCIVEGCTTKAVARKVCTRHGARGKCINGNCKTNARQGYKSCYKHGGHEGKEIKTATNPELRLASIANEVLPHKNPPIC